MRIGIQTWGSEGDVRPLVALADALVARGHVIELVITPLGQVELPESTPTRTLRCVPPGPPVDLAGFLRSLGPRAPSQASVLTHLIRDLLVPALPVMDAAADDLAARCDLLLGHFIAHPLHAAALAAGKPFASLSYFPGLVPTASAAPTPFPDLGRLFNPLLWRVVRGRLDRLLLDQARSAFARRGRPLRHVLPDAWFSASLNLVAASPALWQRPADWAPQHVMTGEFIRPAPPAPLPDELEAFLAAGPPPVYLGLGSPQQGEPELATAALAEGARRFGGRALVRSLSAIHPPGTRDGTVLFIGAVDHRALFPRCAATLHHGGAGTCHAAARAGIPTVVVPFIHEQTAWGLALGRAGTAPPPLPWQRATPERIASRLHAALEPQRIAAARALAARMAGEDGLASACALLEAHATHAAVPPQRRR